MRMTDFKAGTAYIMLVKSDFVDPKRFDDYAEFMEQWHCGNCVVIPIDHVRAIDLMRRKAVSE